MKKKGSRKARSRAVLLGQKGIGPRGGRFEVTRYYYPRYYYPKPARRQLSTLPKILRDFLKATGIKKGK